MVCRSGARTALLLLRVLDLINLLHDLAKHDDTIAVQERNARKTLAVLERVDDERLLRSEVHLGHLVRLERMRILHLLAASLLAIFQFIFAMRHAERPQRTKPIGE